CRSMVRRQQTLKEFLISSGHEISNYGRDWAHCCLTNMRPPAACPFMGGRCWKAVIDSRPIRASTRRQFESRSVLFDRTKYFRGFHFSLSGGRPCPSGPLVRREPDP